MTEDQLPYHKQRALRKNGLSPALPTRKPKTQIKKISDKRVAENKKQKELLEGEDTMKEKWFQARRKEMIGICACGCGEKSQKNSDMYFRHSIAHIFPTKLFLSVHYLKLNWVEKGIRHGDHGNMDNRSMNLWPNFADWT